MNQKNTAFVGNENYEIIYQEILDTFRGDINKMYEEFEQLSDNMQYFGETKEKALKNYCRFKSDRVLDHFYK